MYSLKYNLFDSEIDRLSDKLDIFVDKLGDERLSYLDYKDINVIETYIYFMKKNRLKSKSLLLLILNDTTNTFNESIKTFFNNTVLQVINKKNEFLNDDLPAKYINPDKLIKNVADIKKSLIERSNYINSDEYKKHLNNREL